MPYEKVGKNEPVCIADEVPFEIPESWEWVRLGTISTYAETKKKMFFIHYYRCHRPLNKAVLFNKLKLCLGLLKKPKWYAI